MSSDLSSLILATRAAERCHRACSCSITRHGWPARHTALGRPRKEASPATASTAEGTPKKRVLSPEGRRRIIEATKKRWAAQRAAQKPAAAKRAAKKGGMTAAGRKRLSEMMKARWASKNPPKKRTAAS